ncbi:1-acyl-sn-glycerol-3-phosphate acyltransferase [Emticicia sp. TH156]|uniref:1-acyl-sn-glycerol-3-phosphate acyltransferase n=1 Tax=Emticicia sp. TH156 TaxID=2067454 RepID=UPI000C779304|nr:1-acyl-sn-glycerol-3-phosphate acyltransferase [Emticicia sp. TH156]PLK46271.1 glycerol acyltransferase [Emticicia sp. TH156]
MLYYVLRPFVWFLLKFFTRRIYISGLENIPKTGAVLLASNHSNSFLDAVLLCTHLDRRIWSLARGDVFKKPLAKKALSNLFMMPMYRLSEGKEYLGENDETFRKCIELFREGEIVLIFSEGLCIHQKELLPLKKGTGRLAQKAWNDGIEVIIVPVGISYNNFDKFGKVVNIQIGEPTYRNDLPQDTSEGLFLKEFNRSLTDKLKDLLSRGLPATGFFKNPFYYIGALVNFPVNWLSLTLSRKITRGSVFFDSIALGIFIILMPVYWLLLALLVYFLV